MKKYLTDRALRALKAAEPGKNYVIWDGGQEHLGVRVNDKLRQHALFGDSKPRPLMTFTLLARRAGDRTLVWHKLGRYPEMSLSDAREAAREALRALARGKHPKEITEEKRRAEEKRRKDTFGAVADEFIKRHVSRLRTARGVEATIRRDLLGQKRDGDNWVPDPARKLHWRDRPVTDISRRDVVEMIEAVADRDAPYAARNLLAYTKKLYNWALARDTFGLDANPAARIKAADLVGKSEARDRVLEDHELRLIWTAAKKKGYPFGALVQVLALTGQRLGEWAGARAREIDEAGTLLVVPAERMKGKVAHAVPLTARVIELLGTIPRFEGTNDYLFTTTFGRRPVSGFSKAKADLDKTIAALVAEERARGEDTKDVGAWRLHDLRRTVRTRMSGLGVLPLVAELVLAHKQQGVSAVYDRHRYDREKLAALLRWEQALLAIVEPQAPDERVADLSQARAKRRRGRVEAHQ